MKTSQPTRLSLRTLIQGTLVVLFIILTVLVQITVSKQDFYELLGIERDASHKDIRRAFKKLALSMHPDKNQVSKLIHYRYSYSLLSKINKFIQITEKKPNEQSTHIPIRLSLRLLI